MKGFTAFVFFVSALSLMAFSQGSMADEACDPAIGRLVSVQGLVEVRRAKKTSWHSAALEAHLCAGDSVRVGIRSRAAISLINQSTIRIDQNTTLNLISVPETEPALIQLIKGAAKFFSRRPRSLRIDTPFVSAAVEGTEFFMRVGADQTRVTVFEGKVATSNAFGSAAVESGQSVLARTGGAPTTEVLVRPRDTVRWTLHYPPILATQVDPTAPARRDIPDAVGQALALSSRGDIAGAFSRFAAIPEGERGVPFHLYRAALLLNVGRVDEAEASIDKALALDPSSGSIYALRAVIAVAQNDREGALADARQAVELAPHSVPPRIALSYALQASFRLQEARDELLVAVAEEPEDALAWARLAELWLGLGYRRRALEAAEKAAELAPELSRTETVLGLAALVSFRPETAKKAFERAIRLDSADPLSRFGLGLAKIRRSNLAEGRNEIEIAVGLDPNNALLRTYLGKAYFEERADTPGAFFDVLARRFAGDEIDLAAEQFTIAKELDPKDPTPWFYSAIEKQSQNRPVEALNDVREAIRLNDNRIVFRSRELLDEDRAARGASLARIYDDLGFRQLGINEAAKSLAFDPASTSAHRFLSDINASQRRREISRISELLQAQLLQDVNINPVQPSLGATNLNIFAGGGPTTPGLSEYTPVFERNRAQLNVTGEVGNNNTRAGEAVVSGVYDRFSLSAGQFYYDTDGFRENYDLEHSITNIFAQAAVTPEVNVQGEVRIRRTEYGDRALRYDPDFFIPNREEDDDEDMVRFGIRFSPSPRSDLIGSAIYTHSREKLQDSQDVFADLREKDKAVQVEGAYLYNADLWNVVAGYGFYEVDRTDKLKVLFPGFPPFVPPLEFRDRISDTIEQHSAYAYSNIEFPEGATWTLGFGYDVYDQEDFNRKIASPKLGLQWDIFEDFRLRLATLRTVKPAPTTDRTIQPTQIAGFNQFFDDVNGTESWLYGVGLDARLTKDVSVGLEASARDISVPSVDTESNELNDQDERLYRGYLYWTPHPEWALRSEVALELFDNDDDPFIPKRMRTLTVPLSATYFSPQGFFAGATGTYVNHKVNRRPGDDFPDGHDSFVLADAAVGFRFPERRGLISFEVRNLFDNGFSFQDDNFRDSRAGVEIVNSELRTSPFVPERTFLARVTLNF